MQTGRHTFQTILAILAASCLLASCTDKTTPAHNLGLTDGRYDGEYPASGDSSGMETVIRSVKKLYSVRLLNDRKVSVTEPLICDGEPRNGLTR